MSRAFVKEDDHEESPIIPERAPLPDGETNYVTPQGMEMLLAEQTQLENERAEAASLESDTDRRRVRALINGKLKLLEERIHTAHIVEPDSSEKQKVRFGATVEFKMSGKSVTFRIVGVDEADASKKKIAFTAPIARAILGKKQGDHTTLKLGAEERPIEIIDIRYSLA